MHSLVFRTIRLRPLRPLTRRALRRHNSRKGRNQIAFSFGTEEARRQWEEYMEEERRKEGR
jgi:hypothetical protein